MAHIQARHEESKDRTPMRGMTNFKFGRAFATVGFVLALLALFGRAEAQLPGSLRYYFYMVPTAEESLADEYGQAMVAELSRLMSERVDHNCLRSSNLSASALKQVAGDILTRYGSRVWPLLYPKINDDEVEAEFAKIAGAQGVSEIRSFANDPIVQRIRSLSLPVRRDSVVDAIARAFDTYLWRANLDLGKELYPINSGNDELLQLAEKRNTLADDEVFKAAWNQAWFQRFVELRKALDTAVERVVEASGQANAPAYSAFEGVEADLRTTCVRLGK